MTFLQGLAYIGATSGIYISLFVFELLTVKKIVSGFEFNYIVNIIISLVLALVINTIITRLIVKKLPFKPKGLKKEANDVNWHTYE